MASDPIRQLKMIEKKINDAINDVTNAKSMEFLAKESSKDIKNRTQKGFGVNSHNSKVTKLNPLKESTISIRRSELKRGRLSNKTSPTKSNLIRTGQLNESIKGKGLKNNQGRVFLNPIRSTSDGKNNVDIKNQLDRRGFRFFNFSKEEVQKLAKRFKLLLRKEFVKVLSNLKSQ